MTCTRGWTGPCWPSSACPKSDVSSYGIVDIDPAESLGPGVHRVRDLVEKPPRTEAPSNLAIIGRYILTPDIFPALEATSEDRGGEIQLTNGLRRLLKSRPIYTCEIKGVRHDTGNKLGYSEGDGLLRAAPARSGGPVPRISREPGP